MGKVLIDNRVVNSAPMMPPKSTKVNIVVMRHALRSAINEISSNKRGAFIYRHASVLVQSLALAMNLSCFVASAWPERRLSGKGRGGGAAPSR